MLTDNGFSEGLKRLPQGLRSLKAQRTCFGPEACKVLSSPPVTGGVRNDLTILDLESCHGDLFRVTNLVHMLSSAFGSYPHVLKNFVSLHYSLRKFQFSFLESDSHTSLFICSGLTPEAIASILKTETTLSTLNLGDTTLDDIGLYLFKGHRLRKLCVRDTKVIYVIIRDSM